MNKRKAQSAMEYLMTYGWAVLVVLIVLAALFYFGVFDSSDSEIKGGVEGPFTYDLKVGQNGLQISLKTLSLVKSATVESIKINGENCIPDMTTLTPNINNLITCTGSTINLQDKEKANLEIALSYTQQNSQVSHSINIDKTISSNGENIDIIEKLLTNFILAYYKFDTLNENSIIDEKGLYPGTASGGLSLEAGKSPTFGQSGKFTTTTPAPYIYPAVQTTFPLNQFSDGTFSISMLVKADTPVVSYQYTYIISETSSTNYLYLRRNYADPTQLFFIISNCGNGYTISNFFSDTNWHHLILVVDSSTSPKTIKVYKDGSLRTIAQPSSCAPSASTNLKIGRRGTLTNNFAWFGNIDEVILFNKALTTSEITDLYAYYQ